MPHDGWHGPGHDHDGADHGSADHGHRRYRHRHHAAQATRRLVLAAATLLPFGGATAQSDEAATRIAERANDLLGRLDDSQRKLALIDFGSANRFDWHYIPRSRSGLALGDMQPDQAEAARALFASVLNEQGLRLLEGVRLVEGVLREQQGSFRDPGRYYVSIFGRPGSFPWGWRFEGHHLSLNVTLPAAGHVAVTPFFVGAHPATVRNGPHQGFRLLGASEDLARQIMSTLPGAQQRVALIANRSFGEIVASPQRERDLGQPRGLALADMGGAARQQVFALMDSFLAALTPDLTVAQKRRVAEQGLEQLRFAWAGSLQPGEAHYFRVHGPATLIEHDNTQNAANHVHSVWRDLAADFGHDILAAHYRDQRHR